MARQHQHRRLAALQPRGPDGVPQDGLQGGGEVDLASFSERAGFAPKPESIEQKPKPGFRGGRAFLVFFLCNAVPFGGLVYYLREQRSQRTELSLVSLPVVADDVAMEALRVIRTSAASFLVQAGAPYSHALRVDPHPPEGTAYAAPTEPLPYVPQLERSAITDMFESPPVAGLGFIHLAVSRSSASGSAVLAGDRRVSLLYISNVRGAYCTVNGQASILGDPETRRRYWKDAWVAAFPRVEEKPAAAGQEERPPWLHGDYLLLRLAVDEVALHPVVDGPQRWEQRRIQRVEAVKGELTGARWTLLAPG